MARRSHTWWNLTDSLGGPGRSGRHGSALILTVVLTSLLAVIGVLFALMSRLDRMAARAMIQDRQLDLAVNAVLTTMERQLVLDLPGIGSGQSEYQDYPDQNDPWLACLEPGLAGDGTAVWGRITDLTGYMARRGWAVRDVPLLASGAAGGQSEELVSAYQPGYQPIAVDPCSGEPVEQMADADGDGIADAKWVPLEDIGISTGQRVYLAARIVDNCGMLNVNTAFAFDANDPCLCDGLHQMQLDLVALAERGGNGGRYSAAQTLMAVRSPGQADWRAYLADVVLGPGPTPPAYAPFDICDELRLRYRYVLNYNKAPSRIETFWSKAFEGGPSVPIGTDTYFLNDWLTLTGLRPSQVDPQRLYDYRHVCTAFSVDRLIDPCGLLQVNLNTAAVNDLFAAFTKAGLEQGMAAQLAVNVRDFADGDSNATPFQPSGSATTFWGLEPQLFIRQIGFIVSAANPVHQANNEFVVEFYNPFEVPVDLGGCVLVLVGSRSGRSEVALSGVLGPRGLHKISSKDPNRSNLVLALFDPTESGGFQLRERYDLYLIRRQGSRDVYLDRQVTDDRWFDWNLVKGVPQFYARPDANWNVLYQQVYHVGQSMLPRTPADKSDDPQTWDWVHSRATRHNYNLPSPRTIWLSGARGLVTVGDLARLLVIGPRADDPSGTIGQQLEQEPDEAAVRLDLAVPGVANLFNYVTVLGPLDANTPDWDGRMKGRININTAPAFVLDRLPWFDWVRRRLGLELGAAIVQWRAAKGPFTSIAQLANVPQLQCMLGQQIQESGGPDLTAEGQYDDLEARDLLFSRVSNLVTVRSDLFTAYFVVRLGPDGPQRRMMAILDRSQVRSKAGRPRLLALHLVPDPR